MKSYVKIFPASGKFADMFVGQEVEITEKIDGSQFVFGKNPEGKLFMRSKGAVIDQDCPPKLFKPAVDHVLSIQERIPSDTAYYSETLSSPRHNTLKYGRVPINHIALYGHTDYTRTKNLDISHHMLRETAEHLDIEAVPLLYMGTLNSLIDLKTYLDRDSVLNDVKIEGVVVKNYQRDLLISGEYFPLVAMKYVSEAFKEQHSKNSEYTSGKSKTEEHMLSYKTEARWLKAVQHLRDDGKLEGTPKDIGILLKELNDDFELEEKEAIKDFLYSTYRKDYIRAMSRGFPEWYKDQLLK